MECRIRRKGLQGCNGVDKDQQHLGTSRGTELANLPEDEPSTLLCVPYLIIFVHDDEEIGFFFAGGSEEFLGGECEVVLGGDDKATMSICSCRVKTAVVFRLSRLNLGRR
jgi:hypothetical protein